MKRLSWRISSALCAVALAACASVPPGTAPAPPPGLFEDAAFAAPRHAPDAAAVFALSPAMREYLDVELAGLVRQRGRQRALTEALMHRTQLRLEYDAEITRSAAEAFEARAGNCLSLVVMAAAMAKHFELPLAYQALVGHETWTRSGDLSLVNGHVNLVIGKRLIDRAAYDADPDLRVDFGALPMGRGQALRPVSEPTLLAMFMNNRAAEHLVRGDIDDAYAHAREAVRQDPLYAGAYNTLGVIYQRRGLAGASERAYRAALARDERHAPALQNIARLLRAAGRGEEARPFEERLAAVEHDPPFAHFDLGVAAVRAGRYAEGREHLLAEMKRDPDYHEFHFWLAVALYGLGEVQPAREHLDQAARNSITLRERDLYSAKLRALGGATRTN